MYIFFISYLFYLLLSYLILSYLIYYILSLCLLISSLSKANSFYNNS